MAVEVTCDACGRRMHTDPNEPKYRVDFFDPRRAQGFDVCEECYKQQRKVFDSLAERREIK